MSSWELPGPFVARCVFQGTARSDGGRLVVWNPLYRIESDADREST